MIFRHLLNMRSHPTWVRGLKLNEGSLRTAELRSHPTWVRGLKLIEVSGSQLCHSRTLRGCVD